MFECLNKELAEVSNWVSQSLESKTATPSHNMVRMKVSPDDLYTLHVSSVNRDTSSKMFIILSSAVEAPFDFLIPGPVFLNYIKNVPQSATTKFSQVDTSAKPSAENSKEAVGGNGNGEGFTPPQLLLKSGKFAAKVTTLTSSLAVLPPEEPSFVGKVSGSDFSHAVRAVVTAAASDKTAIPVFTGVQFSFSAEDETMTLTATDRYRLATVSIPYTPAEGMFAGNEEQEGGEGNSGEGGREGGGGEGSEGSGIRSFVLPAKVLEQYSKFFAHTPEVSFGVGVEGDMNQGVFVISDGVRTSTSRLLDGDYPNWKPIVETVETSKNVEISVPAENLLASVKRVAAMNGGGVSIVLTFREDDVTIKAEGVESVDAEDATPIQRETGAHFEVKYASEYILSALSWVTGEVVYSTTLPDSAVSEWEEHAGGESEEDFVVRNIKRPGCFTPTAVETQGNFTYILMPLG